MNYILLISTALGLSLILFSILSALDVVFHKAYKYKYDEDYSLKDLLYMFINRLAYMLILVSILFLVVTVIDSARVSCQGSSVFIKCKPFIWESLLN